MLPIRDFQIKKYPNSFLWNGLLARPYLEQAGSLLHKIGEIISWKSLILINSNYLLISSLFYFGRIIKYDISKK
jgi:hypothetical protein